MVDRNSWVDNAKAIGIILVVFGHVFRGLYNAGVPIDSAIYTLIDSVIYSFHMPLFFFLSGLFFTTSLQNRGAKGLLLSKVDTIIYPYILWSLLQGFIEATLSTYTNGSVGFSDVLALLWQPRAQYWFLYALFLVFFVCSIIFRNRDYRFVLFFLPVAVMTYVYQDLISINIYLGFISNNLVFFVVGILFGQLPLSRIFSKPLLFGGITLLFVLSQYFFHFNMDMVYSEKGYLSLLLAIISIIFIVALSDWLSRYPLKFLVLIGTSSLAIYLMHVIFGAGSRVVLIKLFDVNDVFIHLVIGCIFGVIAPILVLALSKRINFNYLLSAPVSRIFYRVH